MERICSPGRKFFPCRVDLVLKGALCAGIREVKIIATTVKNMMAGLPSVSVYFDFLLIYSYPWMICSRC